MEELLVEGFEGVYALCEQKDKQKRSVPKYRLPLETRVGDLIFLNRDGMYEVKTSTKENHGMVQSIKMLLRRWLRSHYNSFLI